MKYTTAAEAPWQNGLCERVHQVTDMILTKLKESYPNVHQTLLAWANMARNSLQMYNGFSSHLIYRMLCMISFPHWKIKQVVKYLLSI